MCGICGRYRFLENTNRLAEEDTRLIRRMCAALKHRGPDDEGTYREPGLVLGHRRLSIIGVDNGRQPIANEDKSVRLIFNGEIYNYRQLKKDLVKRGHVFQTGTDCETIVHLYEEHGPGFLEHLNGMFALALWDKRRQRLLLARDRLGQKPLNYFIKQGTITFSSEFHSLLQDRDFPREVNFQSLHHYLTFQYVPSPDSMFEGVKKLPPAHWLMIENGRVTIQRYWSLQYLPKIKATETELLEMFTRRFEEAAEIRMMSEVPLGAFLSGGIDSSAVVYAMAKQSGRPIKTFTVSFEESGFDESDYARRVAERFGCQHQEFLVRPDCLEVLPNLIRHYGEPFADPSAIPTYYVCREARRHVTVALCGDGGDEMFAGYRRYASNAIAQRFDQLPGALRKTVGFLARTLPETGKSGKAGRYLGKLVLPEAERYLKMLLSFDETQKRNLYSNDLAAAVENSDSRRIIEELYREVKTDNPLDRVLYVDSMTYLPDDLLVKIDIASMCASLEARSPFLDHELFELVARFPAEMKLKGLKNKFLLKKYLEGKIPGDIINRPKAGFSVPISQWFRGELKGFLQEVLLDTGGGQFFKRPELERLIHEHQSGSFDHGFRLWPLLNFMLWYQSMIINYEFVSPKPQC